MERKPVKSSNLKSVGYDPATKTMEVEFSSGSIYEYGDVPAHEHSDLVHSSHPGAHFSSRIRAKYTGRKL